jgi:hypothetical protein
MKSQLAEANLIDWQRRYGDAPVNEWLPTRLGDGTVTVAVKNLISPFTGEKIEALPISVRWLGGVALPDKPIDSLKGQFRIGTKTFTYDHFGVRERRS